MTFIVATYNVLATGYVQRERYPNTPLELLRDARRKPALAEYIAALEADIYCLQEVERDAFTLVRARLEVLGYVGTLAMKGGQRPDGCAAFFRTDRIELFEERRLEYDDGDGGRPSGYVAQLLLFAIEGRTLHVATRRGLRQVQALLAERDRRQERIPWIICGDLNATPDSDVIGALRSAGFTFTHAAAPAPTCNANRLAKLIDYVLYEPPLLGEPCPVTPIDDTTPLPSATEPSDHVPVLARLRWGGLDPH
jgi:mRNA deadenylase 3'-5' endonuclease subunit Ccr4